MRVSRSGTGARRGWRLVRVTGESMTPTLLDGDVMLVRFAAAARVGDVVLARFRARPDLIVVKRAASRLEDGWLLASDNQRAGADYGVADVLGVARRIWRRRQPLPTSWLGRALSGDPPVG